MIFPTMPQKNWVFPARIDRVVDGDTCLATLDLGLHMSAHHRLRLAGINTPELVGAQHERGQEAKSFVLGWWSEAQRGATDTDWPLLIMTNKTDDYGRYVATLYNRKTGNCLNQTLLDRGLAAVWPAP